jgi:hypothetical protein
MHRLTGRVGYTRTLLPLISTVCVQRVYLTRSGDLCSVQTLATYMLTMLNPVCLWFTRMVIEPTTLLGAGSSGDGESGDGPGRGGGLQPVSDCAGGAVSNPARYPAGGSHAARRVARALIGQPASCGRLCFPLNCNGTGGRV